ncbi:MAG: fructose-bisphosphate aldolase [SAR86 cluster bacterium]
MQYATELETTIKDLVQTGRGVLAADESAPTIKQRFDAVGIVSSAGSRRAWRSLLITTPGLGEYISGIILFDETLDQKTDDGSTDFSPKIRTITKMKFCAYSPETARALQA